MKRILLFCTILLVLTSCGTYRSLDLNQLSTGMTTAQVEYIAGPPYKVLASNNTYDGNQIILAYRTYNNDVYALEFWNDYLVGYEYLYSDVQYIPSPAPPAYMPPMGRPVMIINDRPGRPSYNNGSHKRPTYNSGGRDTGGRYSSGSSSSNSNRPSSGSTTSSSNISGRHSSSSYESSKPSSSSSSSGSSSSSTVGRTSSGRGGSSSNSSTSPSSTSSGRNSSSSSSSTSGRSSSGRSSNR